MWPLTGSGKNTKSVYLSQFVVQLSSYWLFLDQLTLYFFRWQTQFVMCFNWHPSLPPLCDLLDWSRHTKAFSLSIKSAQHIYYIFIRLQWKINETFLLVGCKMIVKTQSQWILSLKQKSSSRQHITKWSCCSYRLQTNLKCQQDIHISV